MGEQSPTSEEYHDIIDSGQGQRWSIMTFLYLSVSSSFYRYDLQVVLSSKYSIRYATLGYHILCMCASLPVGTADKLSLNQHQHTVYVPSCVPFMSSDQRHAVCLPTFFVTDAVSVLYGIASQLTVFQRRGE